MSETNVPPNEQPLSKIDRLRKKMFEDGGLEEIFRHVRNIITSSLIMAAGLYAVKYQHSLDMWGVFNPSLVGHGVAIIGVVLFALSLLEGIHQLAKFRWHFVFQVMLVMVCLMIAIRLEQIVLNFRTS
jgi:hypothetical protein